MHFWIRSHEKPLLKRLGLFCFDLDTSFWVRYHPTVVANSLATRGEVTPPRASGVGRIAIRPDEHNTTEGNRNKNHEEHFSFCRITSWQEAEQDSCLEVQ